MEPHTPPSDPAAPQKPAQPSPAMDIVAPPKMAEPPRQPAQDSPDPEHGTETPAHHSAPKPHAPSEHHSGLGLVVFGTVVIVLGLGAFMVYAYLRSNAISIF